MTGASNPPVYFFPHIPKTAGQTIRLHLAEHCAAGTFLHVARPGLESRLLGRASGDGAVDPAKLRALAGHYLSQAHEIFFPGRDIRRAVLLREPIDLHLSLYNFRMMSNLARGLGTYSFDLHLRSSPNNFMSHHLLGRWLGTRWPRAATMADGEKYALLNRALSQFWFVGSHVDCDRLIAAVSRDLALPPAARRANTAEQWRAQVAWRSLTANDLPSALRRRIVERNGLDFALWESWRDAGFDTARARPVPFAPDRAGIRRREAAARPVYAALTIFRRDLSRRAYIGRARQVARADRARDARDWANAAALYRKALAAQPTAALWVQYGQALAAAGDLAAAEAALREAVRLKPDNHDALFHLGHVLTVLGQESAVAVLLRAAALKPARGEAWNLLIGLGWTEDRIARALARQSGAAPAMPGDPAAAGPTYPQD
jgi:hypothetical protein